MRGGEGMRVGNGMRVVEGVRGGGKGIGLLCELSVEGSGSGEGV